MPVRSYANGSEDRDFTGSTGQHPNQRLTSIQPSTLVSTDDDGGAEEGERISGSLPGDPVLPQEPRCKREQCSMQGALFAMVEIR